MTVIVFTQVVIEELRLALVATADDEVVSLAEFQVGPAHECCIDLENTSVALLGGCVYNIKGEIN